MHVEYRVEESQVPTLTLLFYSTLLVYRMPDLSTRARSLYRSVQHT